MIPMVALSVVLGYSGNWMLPSPAPRESQEPPPKVASAAEPSPLKETVVLPAFSSPLPEGKNAVWCSTFQMAWDRLREQLKEPIKVKGAEDLSGLLNRSIFPKEALPEGSGYSVAGLIDQGILATIERDMKRLFPDVRPDLEQAQGRSGWVAYAYLNAALKFEPRFPDNGFPFKDSRGRSTDVNGFGLSKKDAYDYPKIREQIGLLFYGLPYGPQKVFALDPCVTTRPFQLILAKIPPKASLSETWAEVENRIANRPEKQQKALEGSDIFLCPNITLSAKHHFSELEGANRMELKPGDRGVTLDTAFQSIQFALDRGGTKLESESMIRYLSAPLEFVLDGPFLVILRKREGGAPFFALWVDNPEILHPSSKK